MARIAITCLQSILKALNLVMGAVGIAMILYGIWMIRVWQRDMEGQSFDDFRSTAPWFILLNSDWEKDLPDDPTGRFHDFKEFVKSNFDIFKWIGVWIFLGQGSSALLAMALRTLGPNQSHNFDSDDEFHLDRLPLVNHQVPPPAYVIGDPRFAARSDTVKPPAYAWNTNK